MKLATVAQVSVFFLFVREQRRLRRAKAGTTTSLYVLSRKNARFQGRSAGDLTSGSLLRLIRKSLTTTTRVRTAATMLKAWKTTSYQTTTWSTTTNPLPPSRWRSSGWAPPCPSGTATTSVRQLFCHNGYFMDRFYASLGVSICAIML